MFNSMLANETCAKDDKVTISHTVNSGKDATLNSSPCVLQNGIKLRCLHYASSLGEFEPFLNNNKNVGNDNKPRRPRRKAV